MITGASRGIGLALVKWFSSNHQKVWALSRNTTPITQLNLPNVTVNALDLTDEDAVASWSQNEAPDTIDALINNAGKLVNKPFPKPLNPILKPYLRLMFLGLPMSHVPY